MLSCGQNLYTFELCDRHSLIRIKVSEPVNLCPGPCLQTPYLEKLRFCCQSCLSWELPWIPILRGEKHVVSVLPAAGSAYSFITNLLCWWASSALMLLQVPTSSCHLCLMSSEFWVPLWLQWLLNNLLFLRLWCALLVCQCVDESVDSLSSSHIPSLVHNFSGCLQN